VERKEPCPVLAVVRQGVGEHHAHPAQHGLGDNRLEQVLVVQSYRRLDRAQLIRPCGAQRSLYETGLDR
jgi:hypothetical protein